MKGIRTIAVAALVAVANPLAAQKPQVILDDVLCRGCQLRFDTTLVIGGEDSPVREMSERNPLRVGGLVWLTPTRSPHAFDVFDSQGRPLGERAWRGSGPAEALSVLWRGVTPSGAILGYDDGNSRFFRIEPGQPPVALARVTNPLSVGWEGDLLVVSDSVVWVSAAPRQFGTAYPATAFNAYTGEVLATIGDPFELTSRGFDGGDLTGKLVVLSHSGRGTVLATSILDYTIREYDLDGVLLGAWVREGSRENHLAAGEPQHWSESVVFDVLPVGDGQVMSLVRVPDRRVDWENLSYNPATTGEEDITDVIIEVLDLDRGVVLYRARYDAVTQGAVHGSHREVIWFSLEDGWPTATLTTFHFQEGRQ